jgi:hypothetical protein
VHRRGVFGSKGMSSTKIWVVAMVLLGAALAGVGCAPSGSPPDDPGAEAESRELERFGLATDTSKRTAELDEFLSGGPPKDGIPALTGPEFVPLEESGIPDDIDGVLVEVGDDVRFYPYNIMVWHEIANDVVGGRPIAVTF